jgi:hypothetical protein
MMTMAVTTQSNSQHRQHNQHYYYSAIETYSKTFPIFSSSFRWIGLFFVDDDVFLYYVDKWHWIIMAVVVDVDVVGVVVMKMTSCVQNISEIAIIAIIFVENVHCIYCFTCIDVEERTSYTSASTSTSKYMLNAQQQTTTVISIHCCWFFGS